MVDYYGKWKAEKNCDLFPKNKWCDLDYVASWIYDLGYTPKTTIENLVEMILLHYDGCLYDNDIYFYGTDIEESENGVMISIEDVSCFVEENGGLKEFDYYC